MKSEIPMNEVENTKRVLAGEDPLITSFWCRFDLHRWTQWSDPFRDDSTYKWWVKRKCASCNKQVWKQWQKTG